MTAPLEVDYVASKQVAPLLGLGLFLLVSVAAWAFDVVPGWLGAASAVVFGSLVVWGLVTVRRLRPGVRAARLDELGVTVPGAATVPWSDLRAIALGPMRPAWLLGSRTSRVVSFVPRSGVSLPGPPGSDGRPSTQGRRSRERLYGTNLVLLASTTSVDAEQIAAAAHALGGVPVSRAPHPGGRRWLVVLGGAVVAGLVVGLVSSLVG